MRVLNAMGLKYAVDQELMQAHDQTCEERKKEDGDDTAAPFTRDPGTSEDVWRVPRRRRRGRRQSRRCARNLKQQSMSRNEFGDDAVRSRRHADVYLRDASKSPWSCGDGGHVREVSGRRIPEGQMERQGKLLPTRSAGNGQSTRPASARQSMDNKWQPHPPAKANVQGLGASGGKGGDGKRGTSVANVTATDETLYNAAGQIVWRSTSDLAARRAQQKKT